MRQSSLSSLIICFSFVIILLVFCKSNIIKGNASESTIDYINSESDSFTAFDNWLMDEVGISATPAFIIIKNGKVTNYADTTISNAEFKKLLRNDKYDIPIYEKDISGKTVDLNKYDVIYITRDNCNSCIEQEKFNKEIYSNDLSFLEYKILSKK